MRNLLRLVPALAALCAGALFADTRVSAHVGDVTLKGPVGERLDLMIRNHLLATDTAYITEPFLEKTERNRWWQTEFWGKYMHAAMPFWAYTRDAALRAKIDAGLDNILKSQEPGGYIGNYPDELRCGEGWDVWGMKYTMMGLMHYYDGDPAGARGRQALAACRRLCDYVIGEIGPNGRRGRRLYQTGNWSGYASSSILEPVVWLYKRTKEPRYLDFATYIVRDIAEAEDGPRLVDLALKGISVADRNGYGNKPEKGGSYVIKHNRWKAYEMMSCYQGLLEYHEVTGRRDVFDAALAAARQIIRDEINVAGGCSASEAWYHGAKWQHKVFIHEQETCVITTWMRFAAKLLAATGDPAFADELERSFYNAYLATLHRSGSVFAAYTPLNGYRYAGHDHCRMHTNCCNANGPRGFLTFLRALFQAEGDTAYMNFYVSGRERITLPKSGRTVAFDTYTHYPKAGRVEITNHTADNADFTLALRIPAWSKNTRITVNRQPVTAKIVPGQYCRLARTWAIGDLVTVDFDLAVSVHRLEDCVAFTRGPVLLARDSRFGDGALDEPFNHRFAARPVFTPAQVPNDAFWMNFTASLNVGTHYENPEGANPATVRFCDYASAANDWNPRNACRVWFPLEHRP